MEQWGLRNMEQRNGMWEMGSELFLVFGAGPVIETVSFVFIFSQ